MDRGHKLANLLEDLETDIAATRATLDRHRRDWRNAAQGGYHGLCEELEGAITKAERKLLRLDVQREHVHMELFDQVEKDLSA